MKLCHFCNGRGCDDCDFEGILDNLNEIDNKKYNKYKYLKEKSNENDDK